MALSESLNQALSDALTLTDESKDIAMLIASIIHQPEPNNLKVDIIKEAIQTGQYHMHAEQIANKMLEFVSAYDKNENAILA